MDQRYIFICTYIILFWVWYCLDFTDSHYGSYSDNNINNFCCYPVWVELLAYYLSKKTNWNMSKATFIFFKFNLPRPARYSVILQCFPHHAWTKQHQYCFLCTELSGLPQLVSVNVNITLPVVALQIKLPTSHLLWGCYCEAAFITNFNNY